MEIWVDLSCPWCYGALPVLKNLLHDQPVTWRFVRLHPLAPEGKAYRPGGDVIEYNRQRGCSMGNHEWLHHPLLAHRLLALARDYPLPDMWQLTENLWTAAWKDGLNYADLSSLKSRLSLPDPVWAALEAEGGQTQVEWDRTRANEIGLDGVPRVYTHGKIIPAWHDPADVARMLDVIQ